MPCQAARVLGWTWQSRDIASPDPQHRRREGNDIGEAECAVGFEVADVFNFARGIAGWIKLVCSRVDGGNGPNFIAWERKGRERGNVAEEKLSGGRSGKGEVGVVGVGKVGSSEGGNGVLNAEN